MPTGPVDDAEIVTRFVYEDSYFRADGTVRPKAFYCDKDQNCSVLVTTGLSHEQTTAVASQYVTPFRNGKPLQGYASLGARSIRSAQLDVHYDEPPPQHANIIGYAAEREKVIQAAQLLALAATFVSV